MDLSAMEASVRPFDVDQNDGQSVTKWQPSPEQIRTIYDYAECINLAVLLRGRFPDLDDRLATTLADLLAHWQKPRGIG